MNEFRDKIITAGLVHLLALDLDSPTTIYRTWFDAAFAPSPLIGSRVCVEHADGTVLAPA